MRNIYKNFNILKLIKPMSKKYANLPDSYIKRASEQVYWRTPKGPQYMNRIHQRTRFQFGLERPWTNEFSLKNAPGVYHAFVHVQPIKKWHFFRGDRVEILVGKDKGKQGLVKEIIEERNWVIVEGLNTKIELLGAKQDFPGIAQQVEQPLLVTEDVLLVDPTDLKGTRITWRYDEFGNEVRVSNRSGRLIPIPQASEETIDYKKPSTYNEGYKDTATRDVETVTFQPSLKTFEMDIMEKMGIKEDRIQKRMYWY